MSVFRVSIDVTADTQEKAEEIMAEYLELAAKGIVSEAMANWYDKEEIMAGFETLANSIDAAKYTKCTCGQHHADTRCPACGMH